MSVKFDSGRRKKKNGGLTAAIGMCLAAVCLVAAAAAINSHSSSSEKDYISDYISNNNDSAWLGVEDTGTDSEVYLDQTDASDIPADTGEGTSNDSYNDSYDVQEVFSSLPDASSPSADELTLSGEEAVTAVKTISYRMPLDGDVIKDYSGDELVYCSTMCDWRVHQGVDIGGTLDCEVYAAADGVVVDFVEDMLYGYTAIIRQSDDSMLYYCGLSSVPKVTAGLEVHAGDVIGYLGIVPSEANDPPHLHLSMMKDGSFVDPLRAMGL